MYSALGLTLTAGSPSMSHIACTIFAQVVRSFAAPTHPSRNLTDAGPQAMPQARCTPKRAGGVSEHYNTFTSPSSVADAIEHIAERIMVKAAEQATRVVDREANRTRK